MNWEILLEQQNLADLKRHIKSNSTSWALFNDGRLMCSFLERILSVNNEKDISFRRECISFIQEVFPVSSNEVRRCILSSPIMNGVYDLIKNGQYYEGFDAVIKYANKIHKWWDIKSGLALLGMGLITTNTLGDLLFQIPEKELAEYIERGVIHGDLLNSILSSRDEWADWNLAKKIIRKVPDSLENKCFVNLASKQPDSAILALGEELRLNKELVRLIVLQKGYLDDWDSALGFLSRDIVLSSDDIFKNIAVEQNCEELLNFYDREFIEGEDLKDIISKKGYWDDLSSVERLINESIIIVPKEQNILSALNSGGSAVLDELITDRGFLLSSIEFWTSHTALCPNFTSLCWAHLRDSILPNHLDKSAKHDYSEQVEAISKRSSVVSLEEFMLRTFVSSGQSYTAGLAKALGDGTLVPNAFFEEYKQLTSKKEYTSLHQLASFKIRYGNSLQILRAAKLLGLLPSSNNEQSLRAITEDILAEERTFVRKYNEQYFKYIDEQAHSLFGKFEDTYNELNREQKEAVLTDEDSYLVVSSAGSGKTRVIVSKYQYLTQIKGIKKEAVRILAYTKATRKEINEKKLGMDPEKGAARTFHSFANEVIGLSGLPKVFLKDVQESARKGEVDHSPRAAVLFSRMIDDDIESNEEFMNAMSLYAMSYKAKDKNQNLSFYTDRNGKIGSLKSYQEKVIFDFLADNCVDFAYEELSNDKKATPDFTIYYNGEWIYYEHFAVDQNESSSPYGEKYLADFNRKKEQWGNKLVYTKGANVVDTDEVLDQLRSILVEDLKIQLKPIDAEKRTAIFRRKENYQEVFQSGIKMCLDVYDIIRESCISQEEAFSRCKTDDYANTFMTVLYATVMRYYRALLDLNNDNDKKVDYTGCIEYAMEICRDRKLKSIPWDYILIDEYQDISPLRYEFIKSLLRVNSKLKVLAVGDDWQSIYSFANSDLSHFKGFENDWQYSSKLKMTETFRFNNPLLSASTSFLRNGKDALLIDKIVKPSNKAPKETLVEVKKCDNYSHQISFIKKVIYDKGLSPNDCLILARYKADLIQIRKELPSFCNSDCFMTMHSSKGLTKDYVFILNCKEGVLPSQVKDDTVIRLIRQTTDKDKMNEERRLFYVAITRASKKTFVLYFGTPSVFVRELEECNKANF